MRSSVSEKVCIAGGGLAGCLLLVALKNKWPDVIVELHEKSSILCGDHTWSFHHDDVPKAFWPWLEPLVTCSWPFYQVFFPRYERQFNSKYYSIKSKDLARKILEQYSDSVFLNSSLDLVQADFITVGWPPMSKPESFGYQKFVGLEVTTAEPHGLKGPILKDVREPQTDGYRFFYVLPWSDHKLLIEDTYYSNSPQLNFENIKSEILRYADRHGWKISEINSREMGSLPLEMIRQDLKNANKSFGAAAGLAHPVTGYTLPLILQQIDSVLDLDQFKMGSIKKSLELRNKKLSKNFSFYRLLNRMMFKAAVPEKRYVILERFYRLSEPLIQRFYAGQTTFFDRIRILSGKPPVPLAQAIMCLKESRP